MEISIHYDWICYFDGSFLSSFSCATAGCNGLLSVHHNALLHLVSVRVEMVVEVPGGGQHDLARAHWTYLVVGQLVDIHLIHVGIHADQLLKDSLRINVDM